MADGLTRMLSAASGERTFEPEALVPTDLDTVLAHVATTHATAARRRSIRRRVARTSCTAVSNARQLETLIGSLVANAVKYTPKGGAVLVGCRRRGAQVDIEVLDNGPGIAKDQVDTMFSAFRQGEHSRDGLGLGLWIVQKTAASLGISLSVYLAKGAGTRFVLRMPATPGPRASAPA